MFDNLTDLLAVFHSADIDSIFAGYNYNVLKATYYNVRPLRYHQ